MACADAPLVGLSLAAVRAFVAAHAGRIFEPAEAELASGDDSALCALPFEELTSAQVALRVVKPATAHTLGSYAEMLLNQACGGAEARVFCAADDAAHSRRRTTPGVRSSRRPPSACRTHGRVPSRSWWRPYRCASKTMQAPTSGTVSVAIANP
jgi:hypothetical protein